MTSLTERQHTGEFIVDEPSTKISRQKVTVTVAASTRLQPGHVLAKLSASGKYVEYDNSGSDGSEAAAGVLYGELDNSAGGAPADFTGVVVSGEDRVVRRAAAAADGAAPTVEEPQPHAV